MSDDAEAAIAAVDDDTFTVVAHSIGGVVASEILRLAPERVNGVLAVSAVVPRSGESFVSAMPFPNRVILPLALRLGGTRPPESAIRRGLGHGLDETLADRIVTDFTTEPRGAVPRQDPRALLDGARGIPHDDAGPRTAGIDVAALRRAPRRRLARERPHRSPADAAGLLGDRGIHRPVHRSLRLCPGS